MKLVDSFASVIAQVKLDISPLPFSDGKKDYASDAWANGLTIVFGIFGVVAILMLVINGFLYITSSGDPQRMAQARMGILYSIIGLIVVIFAVAIVTLVVKGIS